ncbi:hypothetical protein [Muribaculum intestinale]|uniref:hypothetical protein n=1 Tax=Muribaculum intestinale TaxID=1796646 RepID=UPI0025AE31FF|nr:hypothetical protein [Muribaculum intestinale]
MTIYSVPAKEYAKAYFRMHAMLPCSIAAAGILAAFIAGFHDMRWWFVAMMAIFIIIPMGVAMAWFIVTGRRDITPRLRPQSLQIENDGFALALYPFDYDQENPEPLETVIFKADKLASCQYGSKYLKVSLAKGAMFDFLLIPIELIPSDSIFQ